MKTPAHYKQKPSDLDRSLLTVVPDAPRVPQTGLPAAYDWSLFGDDANAAHNSQLTVQISPRTRYVCVTLPINVCYSLMSAVCA